MDIANEIQYLFERGFKQEFPNDHTYPHLTFRLDIEQVHEMMNGVYLELNQFRKCWVLDVWCLDLDGNPAAVKRLDYTHENLDKLLEYFNHTTRYNLL